MPAAPLPRRQAAGLAGLAGLGLVSVGVAGCSPVGRQAFRTGPSGFDDPIVPVAADTDLVVVEQARARLIGQQAALRRVVRRHPDLRSRLRPVIALHRHHADLLAAGQSAPRTPGLPRVPRDADAALAAVVTQEQALQAELLALCLRAQSGPLARVLASMAAGTAQRVALLEQAPVS